MSTLRALVVDDEALARRGLSLRLQNIGDIEVITECENGQQALEQIAALAPDVVFLDIQMPGMDGLQVVCELQADDMPLIIFVTAFDQYAVDAFNVHAVDYLLKPIEEERLALAVQRAADRLSREDSGDIKQCVAGMLDRGAAPREMVAEPAGDAALPDRLTIKDGNEFSFVPMEHIQWIDAAGDYMCVHTGEGTHIMRTTMKQLESLLDPAVFLRIHRSSIVNTNFIAGARTHSNGEYVLKMLGGAQLKVSRSFRERVQPLFGH